MDRELVAVVEGIDPFDLLDAETARLDAYLTDATEETWQRPSRCAGWRTREIIAHLLGGELYNQACLEDDLGTLFTRAEAAGVHDMSSMNEWLVREQEGRAPEDLLHEWRLRSSEFRRALRARGFDGTLTTGVGPYPCGFQAWHIAAEYATHADDIAAPVATDEVAARTDWRARFGRFALLETKQPVHVEERGDKVVVETDEVAAALPKHEFVEATMARLPADHPLDARLRQALRLV